MSGKTGHIGARLEAFIAFLKNAAVKIASHAFEIQAMILLHCCAAAYSLA
jgi:hypothetical protein